MQQQTLKHLLHSEKSAEKKAASGSADDAGDGNSEDEPIDVRRNLEDVLDVTEDADAEAKTAPQASGKRKPAPAKRSKRAASKASGKGKAAAVSRSKPPTAPKRKHPPLSTVMGNTTTRRPTLGFFPPVHGGAETGPGKHHPPVSTGADFRRSLSLAGQPPPGATAAEGSEARIPKSKSVHASEDGDGARVASDASGEEDARAGSDAGEATDSDISDDDADDFHSCKDGGADTAEGAEPRTQAKSNRRGSGSAADFEVHVQKYNAAMNAIKALRKDKRYLQSSLDDKCAMVEQQQKTIAAKDLEIVRLKAEVEAAAADTTHQISTTGTPNSAKKLAVIRAKGKMAKNVAMLPNVQQQILRLCGGAALLDFAKAVTRQCDPEAYILEDRRSYKWLPGPKLLSKADAFACGARSAGAGCLGNGLVVEPPMLCANRKAMSGGFFGGYDGRKQDWIIHLARITPKMRDAMLDVTGDTTGRMEPPTDDNFEQHCQELCAGTTSAEVRKQLNARIDSQASYRKDTAVKEYMKKLGYAWNLGKNRTEADLRECEVILRRVLGMKWVLGNRGPGEVMNPTADELMKIAKKPGVIRVEDLRRWRKRGIDMLCKPKVKDLDKAEYLENGADIFFDNFPARAAFMRWSMLPPKGTRTRISAYRDVDDLPTISGDASLLELARLDAWMAAAVIMSLRPTIGKEKDGEEADTDEEEQDEEEEGGARDASLAGVTQNHYHNSLFELLLPRAIEGVLGEVRTKVREVRPDELFMPFDFKEAAALPRDIDGNIDPAALDELEHSLTPCVNKGEMKGHGGDLHAQGWRQITSSHHSPFEGNHRDGRDYVVATPSFIREHVCSWMGDVRDAFVGVCGEGREYLPITAPRVEEEVPQQPRGEIGMRKRKADKKKAAVDGSPARKRAREADEDVETSPVRRSPRGRRDKDV